MTRRRPIRRGFSANGVVEAQHTSIDVYRPVKLGGRFEENIRPWIVDWVDIKRLIGGDWEAYGTMSDEKFNIEVAQFWFYNRIGFDLRCRYGGYRRWRGMIDEVEITFNGLTMRNSLIPVRNAIRAIYTDPDDHEPQEIVGWTLNQDSIDRFGRREEILIDDDSTETITQSHVDKELLRLAWPQPEFVSLATTGETPNKCIIRASGYVKTFANKYVTVGDGTADDVDNYISDILQTDCEFSEPGIFEVNSTQIITGSDVPETAWSEILRALGMDDDPELPPWLLRVNRDLTSDLYRLKAEPTLFWMNGAFHASLGGRNAVDAWMIEPQVMWDPRWGNIKPPPGSWKVHGNDIPAFELRMGDSQVQPSVTNAEPTDSLQATLSTEDQGDHGDPGGFPPGWELPPGYRPEPYVPDPDGPDPIQ